MRFGKFNSFILVQFANPYSPINVRLYKFTSSIEVQLRNAFDLIVSNFGKLSRLRDTQLANPLLSTLIKLGRLTLYNNVQLANPLFPTFVNEGKSIEINYSHFPKPPTKLTDFYSIPSISTSFGQNTLVNLQFWKNPEEIRVKFSAYRYLQTQLAKFLFGYS
jgi:hypothetical protein